MNLKNRVNIAKTEFWLCCLVTCAIAIHLTLAWRVDDSDLLSCSLLFWGTTIYLLKEHSHLLKLKSNLVASTIGLLLFNILLIKSLSAEDSNFFGRIYPFFSILSLGLLASGQKAIELYWQPLLLFGFLAIPWEFVYVFSDLTLLTAKFATFILWLLGFDVELQGFQIVLPTGSVEVYDGCSGLRGILQLLGIALMVIVAIKPTLLHKIWLLVCAVSIGFIINGIRVAIMAVFAALQQPEAFTYWHVGTGSLIFSAIAVALFALTSLWLLPSEKA
jgi:cyanoexosortase A